MTPIWENIPGELAGRKQWLVRKEKIPVYTNGKRRTGEQGSEKDRAQLVTLATARQAFERGGFTGIGFALLPGDGLAGVDLDHIIDADTGEIKPEALTIVQAFNSYTEYSPSGTGLHIIVQGTTTTNKSNDIGFELFCGSQYLTFTGKRFAGTPGEIKVAPEAAFTRLHEKINAAKSKRKPPTVKPALRLVGGTDDFKRINELALQAPAAWVPVLFPGATPKGDGYRVTSKALNRSNQEDLSIMPTGIVDFGLEGTGDPKDGRRTAIDLVIEWGAASKPKDALAWLAKLLGVQLGPSKPKSPPKDDPRPAHEWFSCDQHGLFYNPPTDSPKRIGDPLYVTALARDQFNNGTALQIEFTSKFGQARRHFLLAERLAGDGAQMRAELNSMGYFCPADRNRRSWLLEYLLTRQLDKHVRYVPKVGWYGTAFVLPDQTLGSTEGEEVVFNSDAPVEGGMSQHGTLHAWKRDLSLQAMENSRLVLCICMAFAAPLMHWASGVGGGGVNLIGKSSIGKTTGLQLAASVWGLGTEGRPNSFIQKARATSNGSEFLAEHFNDGLLVLDEMIHLDPMDAGAAIYTLADGVGKDRAKATGGLRRKPSWTVMILTSSEISLQQHMETANKRARGGLDVRLVGVPAEVAPDSMFETTHGFESGSAFADHIKMHVARSYGAVGRAWLEHLVANLDDISLDLRERMDHIEAMMIHDASSGQVRRGGRRFCLIAAAGEIATAKGLTGWPAGHATAMVRACFESWTASREGGVGSSEDASMLAQVRQFIAEHGQLRLPDIGRDEKQDDHAPRTGMRCGWSKVVKKDSGGDVMVRDYFVFVDAFRNIVCKGLNYKAVLAVLRAKELLVPGTDERFDRRERHPLEGNARVYRIKSSILDQEDDA
jgi:uncharacterized protein (DUF927 family)